MAATRFYLGQNTAAPVSPPFSSQWNDSSSADRKFMSNARGDAAGGLDFATPGTANFNVCMRQYVSAPIPAQTIKGTVKGQIQGTEGDPGIGANPQIRMRVVSGDGAADRGVLIDFDNSALSHEFSNPTAQNRKWPKGYTSPGVTVASVACQSGDRIVIEVGYRIFTTSLSDVQLLFRSSDAIDLPEDETDITNKNSWIEFSADVFNPPPVARGMDPSTPRKVKGKMSIAAPGEVRGPSGPRRAPPLEGAPLPQAPQPAAQSYSVPIKSPPPTGRPVPQPAMPVVAPRKVVSHLTNPPPTLKLATIPKMPVNQILEQLAKTEKK